MSDTDIKSSWSTLSALVLQMPSALLWRSFAMVPVLILTMVLDLVTIGAIVPFLLLLSEPEKVRSNPLFQHLLTFCGGNDRVLIATLAGVLIVTAILSSLARFAAQGAATRLAFDVGRAISARLVYAMLHQPYLAYTERNPVDFSLAIERVQQAAFMSLLPLLNGIVSAAFALVVAIFLIVIAPGLTLAIVVVIGATYLAIAAVSRGVLQRTSAEATRMSDARARTVQEVLGGVRDILMDGTQPLFLDRLHDINHRLYRLDNRRRLIADAPRYAIEAIAIAGICGAAAYLGLFSTGLVGALPVLGALAVGGQRILPLIHTAYSGWANFSAHHRDLAFVLDLADLPTVPGTPLPAGTPLLAWRAVTFEHIDLRYSGRPPVLSDVTLAIHKGERIGILGATGSGKSSFLDVFMALIGPTEGRVCIDGVPVDDDNRGRWQARIAHVPQSVYLIDGSIEQNIVYGRAADGVDTVRLTDAIERAQLSDWIATLPHGIATMVGERGVQLSGGQRQRIAIARALYKAPDILILDEATAALDAATERAVIAAIDALGKDMTILIVTHRPEILSGMDRTLTITDGVLHERSAVPI